MKKLDLMPINLQYFADPAGGGSDGDNQTPPAKDPDNPDPTGSDGNDPDPAEPTKKYTDDDVNAIIDKKFAKWKADREAEVAQAKKLGQMSVDQKKDFELSQANERAQAAEDQVAKFQMTSTARKMAAESGIQLTDDDLEHLVTTDADTTKTNLDWLKGLRDRVESDIKAEFLKGNPPKTGGSTLSHDKGDLGKRLASDIVSSQKSNPYKRTEE